MQGKFLIACSSKGGVGKTTISNQVLTALLYEKTKKKVKLIEVDDNNVTDSYTSSIFNAQSFKVDEGIDKSLQALFDVLNDESVVIDAGGGNDTNKVLDAITSMGIDDRTMFFIPILKNKSGMKNLLDTYNRIREKSNARVVVILNQTTSSDEKMIKAEFPYFFGSKELNIKGAYKDIFKDENLTITSLLDTNVYDLSEDFGLTAYEIACEELNVAEFLQEQQKLGYEAFTKALAFAKVFNLCKDNSEKSFQQFIEDITL